MTNHEACVCTRPYQGEPDWVRVKDRNQVKSLCPFCAKTLWDTVELLREQGKPCPDEAAFLAMPEAELRAEPTIEGHPLIQVPANELAEVLSENARLKRRVTELQQHATLRREAMIEAQNDAQTWAASYAVLSERWAWLSRRMRGYREASKRLATCFGAYLAADECAALDEVVETFRGTHSVSYHLDDGGRVVDATLTPKGEELPDWAEMTASERWEACGVPRCEGDP